MPFAGASGWNNVAGLNTVDPQPYSPGINYAEVRYAANGSVERHGDALTEWRYGYMTRAWFAAMKTTLGLSETNKSNNVTIQTLTNAEFDTYENKNAIAILPEPGDGYEFTGGKYLNVVWRFIKLEVVP